MSGLSPGHVHRARYHALRAAAWLVPHLPERLAYASAELIGALAWALTPRQRAGVRDNLIHVLGSQTPSRSLNHLSRAVYRNIVRYYVDLFRLPKVDILQLRQHRLQTEGLDHLQAALAEGDGVILATIHYGAPEVALQAARGWGLSFFVLMEPVRPPELAGLFLRLRSSHGHRFQPVSLSAVKQAVRTLRNGGTVLLVVDRDIQGTGVMVPFFGSAARMPVGAVELSRMTGAPIVTTVCRRLRGGRVRLIVEPVLELARTSSRSADAATNVARLMGRFEPHIRRDPSQWLVLERVWD